MMRGVLCLALLAGQAAWGAPAVWHASSASGAEMWLLGSVHYLRERDHPLPPSIDMLYEQADVLVMELDMDDLGILDVQGSFLNAAMLPPDRSLADVISAETYRLADRQARSLGVELALFERFEPWMAALGLMEIGMAQIGFQSAFGLEQYLLGKAQLDGMDVLGLETLATQIGVFDGLASQHQEALLVQTVQELASAEEAMSRLVDAWRDGRLDTLASELRQDFSAFPQLYETLVERRNLAWADELGRLLQERRRYLVVVGALHLVGEGNVVELLEARGLDVRRVDTASPP